MANPAIFQIQSTAGAIPVMNEKGEVSMQKVKVHRYISGKRPEYAPASSGEEESDEEMTFERKDRHESPEPEDEDEVRDDPRLRRLLQRNYPTEERVTTNRYIEEPEVIATAEEIIQRRRFRDDDDIDSDDDEEEIDETEMEERRKALRQKRLTEQEEELMDVEDEGQAVSEESEESEYEEYTDSEEETGPRLKPVFVRRKDRVTIQERDREEQKMLDMEQEQKRKLDDRRRETLRIVENENRKEQEEKRMAGDPSDVIDSGDENDEAEYELWKQRELKRIKRDKEAKETAENEVMEVERVRTMTDEERRLELRSNPKQVTNKGVKGKYKFLQKYYHRGAFFMDEEREVFKRDFSQPTLEDHFNKTILPKVMQVKNFGRSGRTKYTHLVDQDTTEFDCPWVQETGLNMKYSNAVSGGMKQAFDKPSVKKTRNE